MLPGIGITGGRLVTQTAQQSTGDRFAGLYDAVWDEQEADGEIDREMIRLLARAESNRRTIAIRPVAPKQLYAINRYRIDNGKEALVYTQLPIRQANHQQSY